MILSLIVAYAIDKHGKKVIGKNNRIPWHFPHDLERFKEYTSGSAIIMGRKTHESIGRILPNRDNIIVTRQQDYQVSGAFVFHDLDEAIDFAAKRHSEVFIIGGQKLYEQTIQRADRLYLTSFKIKDVEGDTYFPEYAENVFKPIYTEAKNISGDCFRILQRREKASQYIDTSIPGPTSAIAGTDEDWPANSAYYWGLQAVGMGYGI